MKTINDILVDQVDCVKFLGVVIDSKLNWTQHIDSLVVKLSRGLGAINRAKSVLSPELKLMLYYTMIYPYLSYCDILWGCASQTTLHKLLIVQKRAVRIITNSQYLASSAPLFVRLKLLKISDINTFLTSQYMYKVKNQLLPASCMMYFRVSCKNRLHDTRNPSMVVYYLIYYHAER